MNRIQTQRLIGSLSPFVVLVSGAIAGDPCLPHWDTEIGNPGPNAETLACAVDSNSNLFVGGGFTAIGGVPVNRIARWDGSQWLPLGIGADNVVTSLTFFGGDLYAGGNFQTAGSAATQRIAHWDGANWSDVGGGADAKVFAMTASSISGSPCLYAGGLFENAGGAPAEHIARWEGVSWTALGSGLTTPGGSSVVYAITEFDLGAGPRLAVGGVFSLAGGQPAANIAVWDGVVWSALGSGVDGPVRCLRVFDDGSGPALFAGGAFETAGGTLAKRVARWDGTVWTMVGDSGSWGTGSTVYAMDVFDDGDGSRLIVGGDFVKADGMTALRLAGFDGAQWAPVLGGADSRVSVLLADNSAQEERLMAGGLFTQTGGVPALSIGIQIGCSLSALTGDLNGDGAVDAADLGLLLANFGTSNTDADINSDGVVDAADLGLLLANFGA